MVDSPTSRNRFRKQGVGTNNNTWGTKLNEVLDCVDQVVDGVEAVDLSSSTSYTLPTSDYTTSDQAKNRVLVCSNTNAAGSDLIVPSVEHTYGVKNSGGTTLTVKTSAGTGVAIPTGRFAWVYCDGTNVESAASTTLPSSFTPSNANDPTTKDYVDTAIAGASGLTAPFILVDGSDTTQGYLSAKITASLTSLTTTQLAGLNGLALDVKNSGGDEALRFTTTAGSVGGFLDGGSQSSEFTPSQGYAYDVDCTTAGVTVDLSSMSSVMLGQEIKLNNFGNFPMFLLGTVNGQSNLSIDAPQNGTYRYSGSSWGWN